MSNGTVLYVKRVKCLIYQYFKQQKEGLNSVYLIENERLIGTFV